MSVRRATGGDRPSSGRRGADRPVVERTGTVVSPTRTCVGCRVRADQGSLIRVVGRGEGALLVGRELAGRGAWLCAGSVACFEEAVRRRALARALHQEVASEALAGLREELGLGTSTVQVCEDK